MTKENIKTITLIKRKKNKTLLRFYESRKDLTIDLTQKIAKANGLVLSKKGYIVVHITDRSRDLYDVMKWILNDFVNITGYKKEITKCPHFIAEVDNDNFRIYSVPSGN